MTLDGLNDRLTNACESVDNERFLRIVKFAEKMAADQSDEDCAAIYNIPKVGNA